LKVEHERREQLDSLLDGMRFNQRLLTLGVLVNLLTGWQEDPRIEEKLRRLESLEVQTGTTGGLETILDNRIAELESISEKGA
jgi:hypothetical protein